MEKISKIEILGHSKESNSSVRALTRRSYPEGGQHEETIRCLCGCLQGSQGGRLLTSSRSAASLTLPTSLGSS